MATAVYTICAVTSLACAILLLRGYAATRARLLLWSGICFVGFTVNNFLLLIDLSVALEADISAWRSLPARAGLVFLIYGFIWDSR
jgi:hypothetical protein